MRRTYQYRKSHLFHLELAAIAVVALGGWLLWPAIPPRRAPAHLPPATVAYGVAEVHPGGSLLDPSLFAFASPIGFGTAVHQPGDPEARWWSIGAVTPFTPALPPLFPGDPVEPSRMAWPPLPTIPPAPLSAPDAPDAPAALDEPAALDAPVAPVAPDAPVR